jgi:hypothetical protein
MTPKDNDYFDIQDTPETPDAEGSAAAGAKINYGDQYSTDYKGTDEDTGATMPQGFKQVDSDMTAEQIRAVRRNMYFFHGFVGIILLPLALILRTGRWSMRTLICHHNGDEFGGF